MSNRLGKAFDEAVKRLIEAAGVFGVDMNKMSNTMTVSAHQMSGTFAHIFPPYFSHGIGSFTGSIYFDGSGQTNRPGYWGDVGSSMIDGDGITFVEWKGD